MTQRHLAQYFASALIVGSVIASSPSLASEVRGAFSSGPQLAAEVDTTAYGALSENNPSTYAINYDSNLNGLTATPYAQ